MPGWPFVLLLHDVNPVHGVPARYYRLNLRIALKPVGNLAGRVVAALILNILPYPRQILRAKTHDTIARLPFKHLPTNCEMLIYFMGRRAFELAHEHADGQGRRDGNGHVDVRIRSTNFVNEKIRGLDQAVLDDLVCHRLDLGGEHRRALLAVPRQLEVDLGVIASAHWTLLEEGGP